WNEVAAGFNASNLERMMKAGEVASSGAAQAFIDFGVEALNAADDLEAFVEKQREGNDSTEDAVAQMEEWMATYRDFTPTVSEAGDALAENEKAIKAQAAAAKEAAEEIDRMRERIANFKENAIRDFGLTGISMKTLQTDAQNMREVLGDANLEIEGIKVSASAIPGLETFGPIIGGLEESTDRSAQFSQGLQDAKNVMDLLGISADSTLGKIVGLAQTAIAGFGNLTEALATGDMFGAISAGIGLAATGITAIIGLIGGGRDAQTVMEEGARDMGEAWTKEFAQSLHDNGKNIQLQLPEIFAQGGMSADRLAEEIGDIFSGIDQGLFTQAEGMDAVERSVAVLLQNLGELGPEGEAQVQRIIDAARVAGVEFEGLSELIAGTFAPATVEQLMNQFELTREQVRLLGDETGVRIQNNLQRMAAEAGLTNKEFRALAEAAKAHGLEMDQIAPLAEAMGISVAQLAEAWGVEVAGATEGLQDNLAGNTEEIDRAVEAAKELEKWLAAAASHQINIPVGGSPPVNAQGGFHSPSLPRDTLIQAHQGERVDIGKPGQGGGGGPVTYQTTVNFHGPVSDRRAFEKIAIDAIAKGVNKSRNSGGLTTEINKAVT
ncbi:MAG: hypothetical protein V3U85_10230, partial [Hyphomicrobium sp.]